MTGPPDGSSPRADLALHPVRPRRSLHRAPAPCGRCPDSAPSHVARHDRLQWRLVAEAATLRLLRQLDELALPIRIRSASGAAGSTLLAATDGRHRAEPRRRSGEPFSASHVGRLRHDIGHHCWGRLVGQTNDVAAFRRLFGDERRGDTDAVERDGSGATWDRTRFVTGCAASHPLEDWAETFAHYLHIVDAHDTAIAHDPTPPDGGDDTGSFELADILAAWRQTATGADAVVEPTGVVVDKLAFVHRQVGAHIRRDRFYATH